MKSKLVVFALGWGCDQKVAADQIDALGDVDIMFLCDWRQTLTPDNIEHIRDVVALYHERYLIAWSFGVWAAERFFVGMDFTRAVAVNGTPLPTDESSGIGLRRLNVTLRGMRHHGLHEFSLKAYGEHYHMVSPVLNPRSEEEDERELAFLIAESEKPYAPTLRWDDAITGSNDAIFPPQNMTAYWGKRSKTLPLPHFPFADPGFSAEVLGFDKG